MRTMRWALLLVAVGAFLVGCGPIKTSVYGASGKQYTAPDLCAAWLACRQAQETACYYDGETQVDAQGTRTVDTCVDLNRASDLHQSKETR